MLNFWEMPVDYPGLSDQGTFGIFTNPRIFVATDSHVTLPLCLLIPVPIYSFSWRIQKMSLQKKVGGEGPKKILALDGGGIRGMIAVEVLDRIEELLRKETGGKDEFVLAPVRVPS